MNRKIEKIKNFRLFLLNQLRGLTPAQFSEIPQGYNNNVIWNLGHLICAEQSMCYSRAGLSLVVDDKYFSPYLPTTKPERVLDEQEIAAIKALFITSIDKLHVDFERQIFGNYTSSVMTATFYGVEVISIDDALDFLLYHEGFHAGYIMALKHRLHNAG